SVLYYTFTLPLSCVPSLPAPPPSASLFPYTTLFRSNSTCKGYQSMAAGRRNRDQGLARRPGSRPPASSVVGIPAGGSADRVAVRSEEHTSELQSRENLVCRLLLEKTKSAFLSKSPTL